MRFPLALDVRNARLSLANLLSGIVPRSRARRRIKTPRPYRPRLEMLEDRNLPSTFTVDHLADDLVGSGLNGSLRYCLTQATSGQDTITFGVTGTINLTGVLPDLSHSVRIQGPGANLLTVQRDTGGDYRIFTVLSSTTVSIAGLTIANGNVSRRDVEADGGGLWNGGTLTLSNCTVSASSAFGDASNYYYAGRGYGGGIYNAGMLTLSNCSVSGNSVRGYGLAEGYGYGGGIYSTGMLAISDSTVSGNSATGEFDLYYGQSAVGNGGGIYNAGMLAVSGSTFSGNFAGGYRGYGYGGGIYSSSTVTVSDSTFSGNESGYGGGISNNYGRATINNSTIAGNIAFLSGGAYGTGGGIFNMTGTLQVRNTILSNGAQTASDIYGNLGSQGHNLIRDTQGGSGFDSTDLLNVNPMFGPLQDNGGPTKTMALLAGSPALNAGDSSQLGVADQRGVVRSGGVNIGAYQASASAFILSAPTTITAGTPFDLTVKAVDRFGQTALGYRGTAHFGSTDGQAVLPGDYAFTGGDAGLHTFSGAVTLKTAGSQTVNAADTGTSSLTGSATVAVSPAAADHIFLTAPDSASAGTPCDLVVTIQDQYGNTVTGYTGTVTFVTDDPDGTLPGDYTFTAADAGSHTFSGGVTLYADGSRITVADTTVDTLAGSLVIRLA
jgi:hypothetical protein